MVIVNCVGKCGVMMGMVRNLLSRRIAFHAMVLLGMIIVIFLHCSFEKPQAPQWDLPIQLPLFEKKYSVQELIQNSPHLFVADEGLLGLQLTGRIDTTWVSDRLALDDFTRNFSLGLAASAMNSTGQVSESFTADDIWPDLLQSDAQQMVLPAMTEIRIQGQNSDERDFRSLSLKSGQAILTIENQLPIAFTPITIRLLAHIDGPVLLTFDFPDGIANGQILQKSLDLVELSIPENFAWEVLTSTPGSNGQAVLIKKSQLIKLNLQFKDLIIDQVVAKFKPISITQTEKMTLPADISIDQARFGSGFILLTCTNETELDITLNAEFSEIQTPSRQPLTIQINVRGNSNSHRVIDLKGCTLDLSLPTAGQAQSLAIQVLGNTKDTGENYVTLASQDLIGLEMRMENIYFDQITGRLEQRQFQLPEMSQTIKIPTGLQALSFSGGKLVLNLFSTIDMPIRLQGQVIAKNSDRQTRTLDFEVSQLNKNTGTRIIYTEKNSAILDLLNLLPTSITTTGVSYIGDGTTIGTIFSTDFVCGDYRFESPAILSWNDSEVNLDTTVISITPEDGSQGSTTSTTIDGDLTRRLQKCSLDLTVRHSLPVATQWQMKLSSRMSSLMDQPELTIGPLKLSAPVIDNTGRAQTPVSSTFQIELKNQDLALLKNASDSVKSVYILTQVFLAKSDGAVQFYASDTLSARGKAELSIWIDDK